MKLIMLGFSQRYDIITCVYWFELFSEVSDVARGPLDNIYYALLG